MTRAQEGPVRRPFVAALGLLTVTVFGAVVIPFGDDVRKFTTLAMLQQDLWLAAATLLVALACLCLARQPSRPLQFTSRTVLSLAVAVVAATYAGRQFVLENFDLVRDEQLVGFDAWIYAHGRLVWPIPAEWRPYAEALNLTFMYPAQAPVAWVSSYLPGNALLHAAVGVFADPGLTAPLLAGGSALLLWSCARRLWPDDREAAVVALVVLVLSGQFLVAAMTVWAMTAHLFCNLLWLRLFLGDRRGSDIAALIVGAFATGLHQPLFHPLFVAPFLLMLLVNKRWARLMLFVLGYLAIGLFWLHWPGWIQPLVAGAQPSVAATGAVPGNYLDRLLEMLALHRDVLPLTAANLLRFMVWGNVMAVPLILAAWPAIRRGGWAMYLAIGLVLPIVVLAILLPWQGYGFGYRYLHPVLGNAALLAGFGWRCLGEQRTRLRPVFLAASAGTLSLLLPMQLVMAHHFVRASAAASRTIDASRADYAIIRTGDGFGYANLVFNLPDLSNRPIRLGADKIPDHAVLAAKICRPGVIVAMPSNGFFRQGTLDFGVRPFDTADATLARLRVPYEAAGCRITVLH